MAGSRPSRTEKDDTKKRKRDGIEGHAQSKRPKAQPQRRERHERPASTNGKNSELVLGEKREKAVAAAAAANGARTSLAAYSEDGGGAGWRISKPMGGRMLDVDPILTADEQHLILTYNTSIQVYTAADSLLLRRIPITSTDAAASPSGISPAYIVSTRLSRSDADYVWVACSDAQVYRVNWRSPDQETHPSFRTVVGAVKSLAVVLGSGGKEDVVLVAESDRPHRMELVAYAPGDLSSSSSSSSSLPLSKSILALKKPGNGLQLVEASQDGRVLVGALNDRLFLGVATHAGDAASFEQLQYEFVSWDVPDLITALDLRVYPRSRQGSGGSGKDRVVDILVGGARGAIYLYHDAILRSQAVGKTGSSSKDTIQAQKYHWHRKAVHSVKWSLDGNYIISGGSEQVLVVWQMDTSRKDFLPHLSGSIENIVVSASGSSYVLHLDDNSAMIISTADMKPTAYISGIQSAAVDIAAPKDQLVQRVWSAPRDVQRPIPAAIRPSDPSKLHVCVGNGRQATMTGGFCAPLLQSFDLESFTSVSRQALARTQPTDVNMTNKGYPIAEPLITHIAFSGDGKWLASVDDWVPPVKDMESVGSDFKDQFLKERHESYLKFWQVGSRGTQGVGEEEEPYIALVSRVNAPHATVHPEVVLDLASSNATACFATIGADGMVRLWRPRAGTGAGDVTTWACSRVIPVGDHLGENAVVNMDVGAAEEAAAAAPVKAQTQAQGSVAFSEDGSTVFAAFGGGGSDTARGYVHAINASTGEIAKTLEGLWRGKLQSVRTLGPHVIVLSSELCVYDIVADDLRYGITIPAVPGVDQLLQLAVDATSGHFAVTLPLGNVSSVGVFHPESPEPIIVRSTPHRIVSLVSSPGGASGFVALDDAAQVWILSEGSDPASLVAAQPIQDLGLGLELDLDLDLDDASPTPNKMMVLLDGGAESGDDDDMEEAEGAEEEVQDVDVEEDEEDEQMGDDEGVYTSVIAGQQLADIFDAAPAFAAVSVEDMFYKVTSLLASKPLAA